MPGKTDPRPPRFSIDTRAKAPEAWPVTFQDVDAFEAFKEQSKYFVPQERENQEAKCRRLFRPSAQPGHLSE